MSTTMRHGMRAPGPGSGAFQGMDGIAIPAGPRFTVCTPMSIQVEALGTLDDDVLTKEYSLTATPVAASGPRLRTVIFTIFLRAGATGSGLPSLLLSIMISGLCRHSPHGARE